MLGYPLLLFSNLRSPYVGTMTATSMSLSGLDKTFRTFIAIFRKNLQVLTIHASNTKGFHKRSITFDLLTDSNK